MVKRRLAVAAEVAIHSSRILVRQRLQREVLISNWRIVKIAFGHVKDRELPRVDANKRRILIATIVPI